MNSASWTSFLGVKDGNVYLETGNLITISGNPKVETYWTKFKDLPLDIREMITRNQEPWIPKELYNQND
jgi:hypothetical protein